MDEHAKRARAFCVANDWRSSEAPLTALLIEVAAEVRAEEREACARECEATGVRNQVAPTQTVTKECADRIRARGKKRRSQQS